MTRILVFVLFCIPVLSACGGPAQGLALKQLVAKMKKWNDVMSQIETKDQFTEELDGIAYHSHEVYLAFKGLAEVKQPSKKLHEKLHQQYQPPMKQQQLRMRSIVERIIEVVGSRRFYQSLGNFRPALVGGSPYVEKEKAKEAAKAKQVEKVMQAKNATT